CLDLGAHHVIDHSKPMKEQIDALKVPPVALITGLTNTEQHFASLVEIIAPQGKIGLIDDPASLNVNLLKGKSVSLHWELMFTRAMFQTDDMIAQHNLLEDVANLIDHAVLPTPPPQHLGQITASNLNQAHALPESGRATGKLVLEGR